MNEHPYRTNAFLTYLRKLLDLSGILVMYIRCMRFGPLIFSEVNKYLN